MSINLFLLVLAWYTFAVSGDVAKCPAGGTERNIDNTFSDCLPYGYDATWIVGTARPPSEIDDTPNYMTVNGVWPPPTIKIKVNQRIRIALVNNMTNSESVTLHFHGILQENGYVAMDGPQGVVQTGVSNEQTFIYDFPVRQAGTFWVHSHAPGQYPKGLRSPLVVTDDNEPAAYGYDPTLDLTATVSDWWPNFWKTEATYKNNICGKGLEVPPSKLIVNDIVPEWSSPASTLRTSSYVIPNGKKARLRIINTSSFAQFYVFASDKRPFKVIELDGVKVTGPQTTTGFSVASGQRISVLFNGNGNTAARIYFISEPRVAGGSSSCPATPTNSDQGAVAQFTQLFISSESTSSSNVVDMNDFDYTKSDGTIEKRRWLKTWVDCVDDWAAPYYSGRLKVPMADDARPGSFTKCKASNPRATSIHAPKDVFGYTDIYYQAQDGVAPWKVPTASDAYIHMISIQDHQASDADQGRGEMGSTTYTLSPDNLFKLPDSYDSRTQVSGLPPLTTLQWVLQKENYAEVAKKDPKSYIDGGSGAQTLVLPNMNEVHWLVVRTTRGDHPIHLHGHEFQILARIAAGTDPSGSSQGFSVDKVAPTGWQDFVTKVMGLAMPAPVRRDTIMIERGWTYVLAIKSTNPGVWALHCHNDFHASTGMFMQVVEAPLDLRRELGTWSYAETLGNIDKCPHSMSMFISSLGMKGIPATGTGSVWDGFFQLLTSSLAYWGYADACVAVTSDPSYVDPIS